MHRTLFAPLLLLALLLAFALGCGRVEDKDGATAPSKGATPESPAAPEIEEKAIDEGEDDEKSEDETSGGAEAADPSAVPTPAVKGDARDASGGSGARHKGAKRKPPNSLSPQGKPSRKGAGYREEFGVEGKPSDKKSGDDKGNYREEFGVE